MSEPYFTEDTTGRIAVNPKRVKELFYYDPKTGELIWKERECGWFPDIRACRIFNAKFPGKTTGCDDRKGYLHVRMLGKLYFVHRLVWAWHYGEWPKAGHDLDHVDGNGFNNRIENLRVATRSQNNVNSRKTKGFTYVESIKKYSAQSCYNNKHYNLGLYETKEEARQAYVNFVSKKYGEFFPGEFK